MPFSYVVYCISAQIEAILWRMQETILARRYIIDRTGQNI